jgi:hypothetical protein
MPQDHRGFLPAFYNRVAALLRRIELALEAGIRDGPIYGREAVARRLLQEIGTLMVPELRREDAHRAVAGRPALEQETLVFDCAGLEIDSGSGRVRCGARLWLRSVGAFVVFWCGLLGVAAASTVRRAHGFSATLVSGVDEPLESGDAAFAEFARSGPIAPLNEARFLLVQTGRQDVRSTDPARIAYARNPLLALARANSLGLAGFAFFLMQHARALAAFLFGAARRPLLALLWRDYAFQALVAALDRRGLIEAIVLTNGLWGQQLLWMTDLPGRRFRMHMLFYSMNDRPHAYKDIPERCPAHPTMRHMRADHFWLWTPGQAQLMREEGVRAEMHVAGPIVWTRLESHPREGARWISVFDITPVTAEATLELGLLGNFFSTENMLAFLDGIEGAMRAAGLDLQLVVKPKRRPAAIHDPRYLSRLERSDAFKPLPPETSAATVIASSAAVIVFPFSSVAYLADRLGVPAIYFDPTGRLAPTYEAAPNIRFAGNVAELADALRATAGRAAPGSRSSRAL